MRCEVELFNEVRVVGQIEWRTTRAGAEGWDSRRVKKRSTKRAVGFFSEGN